MRPKPALKTHAPDRHGKSLCGKPGKIVKTGATCKTCLRIQAGGVGRLASKLFAFPIGSSVR